MKNKRTVFLVTCIAIVCLVSIFWDNTHTQAPTSRPSFAPDSTKPTSEAATSRKRDVRLSKLRIDEAMVKRLYEGIGEDAHPNQPLTDEEMARYAIMTKAIEPHFFEKAPKAFDGILEDEQIDKDWTQARTQAIATILDNYDLKSITMHEVRCHEMLCKIKLSSTDKNSILLLQEEMAEDPVLFGAGHQFHVHNGDGTYDSHIYIGRPGEDQKINMALTERLYQDITGESADSVVPSQDQIDQVIAYRDGNASAPLLE